MTAPDPSTRTLSVERERLAKMCEGQALDCDEAAGAFDRRSYYARADQVRIEAADWRTIASILRSVQG